MKLFAKILFLLPAVAMAANLVTYTATSKVSQKDADKKAMEGVALQISSNVKSSFETRTIEKKDGSIESTADSKSLYRQMCC